MSTPTKRDMHLEDFAAQMLQMLDDLHNGYPWKELGISLPELRQRAAELSVPVPDDPSEDAE